MSNLLDSQRVWLAEQLARKGRGARVQLAKALGVRVDAITRMTNREPGKEVRDINLAELIGMAEFFKSEPPGIEQARQAATVRIPDSPSNDKLQLERSHLTPHNENVNRKLIGGTPVPGESLFGEADLPVFGVAQGGRGALVVTAEPVDWIVRPSPLLRVRDGYGIIVVGDSMSPEHKAGSIALVNPHIPPRAGDTCVFRSHADDGTVHIVVKELRGETSTHWKVHQHNPRKDFTLRKDEWQICHRTVGNYFR